MEVSRDGCVPVRLNQVCVTLLPSNTAYKEGFCSACTELNPVLAGGVVRTSWWSISSENSWGPWRSFTSSHLWLFIFRGSGGVLYQCHSETALRVFRLTGIWLKSLYNYSDDCAEGTSAWKEWQFMQLLTKIDTKSSSHALFPNKLICAREILAAAFPAHF